MSISKHLESIMQGHPGHNSQREKAEKSIGKYVMHDNMHTPDSFSSPAHQKTRLYKHGGKVHKLNHDQTDMHIPKREKAHKHETELFSKHELKHGGHAKHHKKHHESRAHLHKQELHALAEVKKGISKERHLKEHKHHCAKGGYEKYEGHEHEVHGDKSFGREAFKHEKEPFKKGGHAKHHHKHHHKNMGGIMAAPPKNLEINPRIAVPPVAMKKGGHKKHHHDMGGHILGGANALAGTPADMEQNVTAMRHGGHMKHKHHSHHHGHHDHHMHKASGGSTVYERQMVGEHPSHHQHHYNYEAEMSGERCISKPPTHSNIKGGHKVDENHHQMFAMGGVGKMRHGQSDKSGHQKIGKVRKGH